MLDDSEREAFVHVVIEACGGAVEEHQVQHLLADLSEQLEEDGLEKRIASLGRTVGKPEHQREVLRIAGLLAHVSGGVSAVERDVLASWPTTFQLDPRRSRLSARCRKSALA